jgi:hypothetical protein
MRPLGSSLVLYLVQTVLALLSASSRPLSNIAYTIGGARSRRPAEERYFILLPQNEEKQIIILVLASNAKKHPPKTADAFLIYFVSIIIAYKISH